MDCCELESVTVDKRRRVVLLLAEVSRRIVDVLDVLLILNPRAASRCKVELIVFRWFHWLIGDHT
jgi:hypothetical protein